MKKLTLLFALVCIILATATSQSHVNELVRQSCLPDGITFTSQGKQQFVWNAEGQPAGVYFCVLKTKTGMHSTKMIKLK